MELLLTHECDRKSLLQNDPNAENQKLTLLRRLIILEWQ